MGVVGKKYDIFASMSSCRLKHLYFTSIFGIVRLCPPIKNPANLVILWLLLVPCHVSPDLCKQAQNVFQLAEFFNLCGVYVNTSCIGTRFVVLVCALCSVPVHTYMFKVTPIIELLTAVSKPASSHYNVNRLHLWLVELWSVELKRGPALRPSRTLMDTLWCPVSCILESSLWADLLYSSPRKEMPAPKDRRQQKLRFFF